MKGTDVMKNLMGWLETRTGDAGFHNKEVSMMVMITLGKKKKPIGWKEVINTHLTLGASAAEELLNDICSLTSREVTIKYIK